MTRRDASAQTPRRPSQLCRWTARADRTRTIPLRACGALAAVLLAGCSYLGQRPHSEAHLVTPAERTALLHRAQVWTATDVGAMDIAKGPGGGYPPEAEVECEYAATKFGGHTPKFGCAVAPHDVVKVRYGGDNGEVYAGVAATRLLWALGFGADALYPVRAICHGCPPLSEGRELQGGRTRFDPAAIERPFAGRKIDARIGREGWSWPELDLVDPGSGGATLAQRDALKLLAAVLQHSDSKSEQQRFVCRDPGRSHEELAGCASPFLLIHDVGLTFGRANWLNRGTVGSVNLELWSHTPIWKDARRCVAGLAGSHTGTLVDPVISEAGRAFLSGLLERLTDAQLRALFTVARFDRKPQGGGTIDAWVAAFKQKRTEISSAKCPS